MNNQQAIKAQLTTSIPTEQLTIYYVVSTDLGEAFFNGWVLIGDVIHYLYSPEHIKYLDPKLIIEGTKISYNKKEQEADIDFVVDPDGANITFDAKRNGPQFDRCVFETWNDDGVLKRFGMNNRARYIVQYMAKTQKCFCFELDKVLKIANEYELPEWFIKEGEWKMLPHDRYPEKRNLYVRPEALSKLFAAMENGNPDNLELPRLKKRR